MPAQKIDGFIKYFARHDDAGLGHVSFSQGVVEQESHYRMASPALHSHQNQRDSPAPLDYFSCRPRQFCVFAILRDAFKIIPVRILPGTKKSAAICELLKLS